MDDMDRMKRLATVLPKLRTEDRPVEKVRDPKEAERFTLYMPPRVADQLRDLSHAERKKKQDLVREAMDMLFANRGCPSWDELK